MTDEQTLDYLKQLEDRIRKLEDNNLILQLEKNIKQFINKVVPIITEYNNNLINLTIQLEILKYHISTTNNMDYKQMFIDYQLLLTYMKQNNLSLQELIQMMNDKLKGESINTYFSVENISIKKDVPEKNSLEKDSIKDDLLKKDSIKNNDSLNKDSIKNDSLEKNCLEQNLIKENNDISNIEKNLVKEEFNKSILNQQEENLYIKNEFTKEEKTTRTKKRSIKDALKEKKQKLIQQTQDLILAENNILQTNENKQTNSKKIMEEKIDNPIETIAINNQLELTEKVAEKKDTYEYEITKVKNKKVIIDDDGSEWISL